MEYPNGQIVAFNLGFSQLLGPADPSRLAALWLLAMHYLHLAIAILGEVVATSSLKATEDFTRLWPSLLALAGYGVAFYFLTLSLKVIPVGIAYAIWAGMGVVLVTLAAAVMHSQVPDMAAVLGTALIISGVVVIHLFSKTLVH